MRDKIEELEWELSEALKDNRRLKLENHDLKAENSELKEENERLRSNGGITR